MEIAQLCKQSCYNQLQQSIYLCHKRNMSQIWEITRFDALAEPKLKVTPWCILTSPNQCPYQVLTFYALRNPRNSLDKILKLMVTMKRSKLKITAWCVRVGDEKPLTKWALRRKPLKSLLWRNPLTLFWGLWRKPLTQFSGLWRKPLNL